MSYDDEPKLTQREIISNGFEILAETIHEECDQLRSTIRNVTYELRLIRIILDKQAGNVLQSDDFKP